MKTQAFSLHSLLWLSNFETNQGYKDRQDPSLTLIFTLNTDEPKFKNPNIVDTCKGFELVGKDYEPLSRISDAFVTPDQLSRHYKIVFMEGGSIPLVRTSLLSIPYCGAHTPPRKTMQGECRSHACMAMAEPQGFLQHPAYPHPPAQMPQKCNVFPKRHLLAVE